MRGERVAGEVRDAVGDECPRTNRFPAASAEVSPVDLLALGAGKEQRLGLCDAIGEHGNDRRLEWQRAEAIGLACVERDGASGEVDSRAAQVCRFARTTAAVEEELNQVVVVSIVGVSFAGGEDGTDFGGGEWVAAA